MRNEIRGVDCNRCKTQEREQRTAENLCYACKKTLAGSDIKFVMPSRVLGAMELPLQKRLMCTQCYQRYATRTRSSAKAFVRMNARRLSGAVRNSFLIKSVQF
jgi:hypothetical protein